MIKKLLKRVLPPNLKRSIQRWRFGRFTVLQWETDGLLSPEVYAEIYATFRSVSHSDVVEIGGASGSASIAIGWALKEGRRNAKLVVVEKCEGGTRTKFGNYDANLMRFWNAISRNGVRKYIDLVPEYLTFENGNQVLSKVTTEHIGGLMIDADGHIHRDFWLFWRRLAPGAPIVIDDYHESLGPKHALTFALLTQMIRWGMIVERKIVSTTFFGSKGTDDSFAKFDLGICEEIVASVCRDWKVRFDRMGLHAE
jgi:hypothetical protein